MNESVRTRTVDSMVPGKNTVRGSDLQLQWKNGPFMQPSMNCTRSLSLGKCRIKQPRKSGYFRNMTERLNSF
jgi:hypothetical protein